ncbi:MAG: fused MFS/spermidine synthase [Lachnospiraceae bacterium]|nr:fused MFS/spermidine synthase [Lachnospiraceae bacterium]
MRSDILKHKTYLYLTEFFAGMSVMAVELGASRLLAPYFSSSQIVWTIIIATIMIAMALGNLYGGRSADRDPNPDRLYARLLLAAVWIAAIPLVGRYIIIGITGLLVMTVNENFLVLAAFAACLVIFVFPCFLLGTCTPSLASYAVTNLSESGSTVGKLGAYNTIGSIIGTFLPTFVTIPAIGTAATFILFSGVLLALSLVYFISKNVHWRRCAAAVLVFVLCTVFGSRSSFAFWEKDLTAETESVYNYLQVKDTEESTVLSTNVLFGVQSITMKTDELTGLYYDIAMAAPVMAERLLREKGEQERPLKILVLGMGTGTFAGQCLQYLDSPEITGVEIDSRITELSYRYFDAPKEANVVTYDGRAFLAADSSVYDVIMVDAYQDITIPFQMSSIEFFTLVREHLTPEGIMVVNMNMRTGSEDGINTWLSDTIAAVFPSILTVDVRNTTNRELFASASALSGSLLLEGSLQVTDAELRELMEQTAAGFRTYESGSRILTDDRAPVELLGMQAIDAIISEELRYYKEIFRKEGISGLLSSM